MALKPLEAAARLRGQSGRVLLHSGANPDNDGRYSFVSCSPHTELVATRERVSVTGRYNFTLAPNGAFDAIDRLLQETEQHDGAPVPVLIGYLGYTLSGVAARIGRAAKKNMHSSPDAWFGMYGAVYRYDHQQETGVVVGEDEVARAELERLLSHSPPVTSVPILGPLSAETGIDDSYKKGVRAVKEYLLAGDVYQVNLSRRLTAKVLSSGDPLGLYQKIAEANPSAFGALLELSFGCILSASPERFLLRTGPNERVETRPIKGTRARTGNKEEDILRKQELLESEKERAEHLMIVDLERNDLGRIAQAGTVSVDSFARVIELPNLFHVISTVSCLPRADVTAGEILTNTFPGGSITGAPKRRAMEVIEELESVPRGVYTGAVGYLSAGGGMDFNIAIRTGTLTETEFSLSVGGGIVADSTHTRELAETEEKAAGWRKALEHAREAEELPKSFDLAQI